MSVAAAFLLMAAAPAQPLDLEAFFAGRTHAENELKIAFQKAHSLNVDSVGQREGNRFVQVDTVHEEGKPVRTRTWVTRQVAPGQFTGTLSDATGPVDIRVSGNRAMIRYTMKGGLNIVQTMQLLGDGRTLSNSVEARKFGLKFATVRGTIRKLD